MTAWKVPVAQPIFSNEEARLVNQVLKEGRVTQGRFVQAFEEKMARFCRAKYAVATSSGTAAVHAALMALGIGKNDEVLTTPLSCIASANPILFQGAKPVFVDIDPNTYNMDLGQIEKHINKKTKAILAVHLFGRAIDMTKLMRIAKKHKLFVIEDACQSLGATHKGKPVGGFGDIGCFSFYANKIITTAEGGLAVTSNKQLYSKLRGIRNLGQDAAHFVHPWIGANYKMSNLHAAVGLAQMNRVDEFISKRRANAGAYTFRLRNQQGIIRLPHEDRNDRHVYFSYHIELKTPALRDKVERRLNQAGVETRPFLSVIPDQVSYRKLGYTSKNVPNAMAAYKRGVYFSCSPSLDKKQIDYVSNTIKKALKNVQN